MGHYWQDGIDEPTPLGQLVALAKDLQSKDLERKDPERIEALRQLERQLAAFVYELDLPLGAAVVGVPTGPNREAHPVPSLAACVAETLDVDVASGLLRRSNPTPRLRDTPAERRRDVVEAAGYFADPLVSGRDVVLVDDVILTGTTLHYLAEILVAAGAHSVCAVVLVRTRLGTTESAIN